MKARDRLEDTLGELVGENIGGNCDCSGCETNRDAVRDLINELFTDALGDVQSALRKLPNYIPTNEALAAIAECWPKKFEPPSFEDAPL
jgi:hypothetical protein